MIAVLGAGPHGRQIAHDLKTTRLFDDWLEGYPPCSEARSPWIVGAMWPGVRRKIAENQEGMPWHQGRYIAPSAVFGIEVDIERHVHVLAGAVVNHGCKLGAFSTIASGATLCGEVTVGEGAFIGARASVIHGGITIGAGATVGIGATVLHDVPDGMTVVGCPARYL